jgi:hypothetical protein
MNKSIIIVAIAALITSCSLDNYDPPSSLLTGAVTFNGQNLNLDHGNITFNLFQDGYEKNGPIAVSVAGDGTFSALVFDGTYHLYNIDDNGPWANDIAPIDIIIKGNTTINVEVHPYYLIENVTIALNGTDIKALCSVSEITSGKNAKQIFLAVGRTQFINDQSYSYLERKVVNSVNVGGSHSFTIDASEFVDSYDCLWARIGLEVAGLEKFIYSKPVRIK